MSCSLSVSQVSSFQLLYMHILDIASNLGKPSQVTAGQGRAVFPYPPNADTAFLPHKDQKESMGIAVFWLLLLFGVAVAKAGWAYSSAFNAVTQSLFRGREFISFCEVALDLWAAGASIEQTVAEYSTVAIQASARLPVKHLELS